MPRLNVWTQNENECYWMGRNDQRHDDSLYAATQRRLRWKVGVLGGWMTTVPLQTVLSWYEFHDPNWTAVVVVTNLLLFIMAAAFVAAFV
jgi:hypothetical protein